MEESNPLPASYNEGINLHASLEIYHDERGVAVRRATENGNGAMVAPFNTDE
jgi:hypothetical protein